MQGLSTCPCSSPVLGLVAISAKQSGPDLEAIGVDFRESQLCFRSHLYHLMARDLRQVIQAFYEGINEGTISQP